MAQADSHDRDLCSAQLFQFLNDLHVFRRVSRAVRQHHTLRLIGKDLLCGGERRNADHLAAVIQQAFLDIFLGAEIPQHHSVVSLALMDYHLLGGDGFHRVFDLIGLNFREQGGRVRLFHGDPGVHHAVFPHDPGQRPGVNAVKAGNVFFL